METMKTKQKPKGLYTSVCIIDTMKTSKSDEDYVRKNITIKKKHERYLKNKFINLSRFVQNKIEEIMK